MKVWPTSEEKRKILKHPTGGKFLDQGGADWPDDSFTHRRIRDGDVTTSEPKAAAPLAPKPERKTSQSTDAAKSTASSKGE
jgi:hypothetical protein